MTNFKGGNSFEKLNISNETHSRWAINLRNFLWATIINPLVKQVDKVNNQLKGTNLNLFFKCKKIFSASLPDVQIGKTSLSDLKAITKPEIQNEIRVLLPYLEVTSNHSYLIARLKKLSEVSANGFYVMTFFIGWIHIWIHLEWRNVLRRKRMVPE